MSTRRQKRELESQQGMVAGLLGFQNWTAAYQGAAEQFATNMLNNMQVLGIGLDETIKKVRQEVFIALDGEPLDDSQGETPEVRKTLREMFEMALDKAEEHLRERVDTARQIVALADQ